MTWLVAQMCRQSWNLKSDSPALSLAFLHAAWFARLIGLPRNVKTASGCLPICDCSVSIASWFKGTPIGLPDLVLSANTYIQVYKPTKGYLKTNVVSFDKTWATTKLKRVLAQPKLSCHEVKTRFSKEGQFLKSKTSKASLTKILKPPPSTSDKNGYTSRYLPMWRFHQKGYLKISGSLFGVLKHLTLIDPQTRVQSNNRRAAPF